MHLFGVNKYGFFEYIWDSECILILWVKQNSQKTLNIIFFI